MVCVLRGNRTIDAALFSLPDQRNRGKWNVSLLATSAGQLASQDWGEITTLAWLALGYSMLLALVLTNVLWFTAIGRVGAARSSLYMNLQPFLGAIFAVLVLSETMSAVQIAGGVVIGLGILVARQTRPRTPSLD